MIANERLWRTADNRLVRDGDEAGMSLAYTPGDEVKPADESLVPGAEQPEEAAKSEPSGQEPDEVKSVSKPADKSGSRSANK